MRVLPCLTTMALRAMVSRIRRSASSRIDCFDIRSHLVIKTATDAVLSCRSEKRSIRTYSPIVRKATNPNGLRSYFQRTDDPPFVYLVEHYSISEPTLEVFSKKNAAVVGGPTWQAHRGSWRPPTQKTSDFEVATMFISEQEQTITQGANIQFNSMTTEVAGNNLADDHHTL